MLKIKPRLKYGLIFLVPTAIAFILAVFFSISCQKQTQYSTHLEILKVPLILAHFDTWLVFGFLGIAMLAILWPKGPHPVLAFGISIAIIFPAIFSAFVAGEIGLSSVRYRNQLEMPGFNVTTRYQRMATYHMVTSLINIFQEEFKCCGLSSYENYCDTTKFNATPDDQHELNMKEINHDMTVYKYLHGNYSENFTRLGSDGIMKDRPDLPLSCCSKEDRDICKEFKCDTPTTLEGIHSEGCSSKLLAPLDPCLKALGLTYVFPWIALIYAAIFSWAHLRQNQGLSFMEFGSVPLTPSPDGDNMADKGGADTENVEMGQDEMSAAVDAYVAIINDKEKDSKQSPSALSMGKKKAGGVQDGKLKAPGSVTLAKGTKDATKDAKDKDRPSSKKEKRASKASLKTLHGKKSIAKGTSKITVNH